MEDYNIEFVGELTGAIGMDASDEEILNILEEEIREQIIDLENNGVSPIILDMLSSIRLGSVRRLRPFDEV